ncbi:MAG TPA: proliferating cell nuclear antigen (pcna) [Candidatus Nanoarchaeia archaeon]|nr:proliferating cell nuclear antigen (pcna) [Candidatus Nanoarchaeia archaeon]
MRLTLAEPRYLKDSIMIISDLVAEGRFKITKDSIELVAMDPANVAMVMFKLLSSSFTEYLVEKDMEIGVNLSNLKSVLRRCKPADMLSLDADESKLTIQIIGDTPRSFSLPLINIDEKEQRVPDLKFPVSITMPSAILNDAIEDVDVVGESVTFEGQEGRFLIAAQGDLSHAMIDIKEGQNAKIKAGKEKVKSKYSIEYLKKMIAGSKLAETVEIRFNKDYPLRLDYLAVDKVQMSFILAPRVDND